MTDRDDPALTFIALDKLTEPDGNYIEVYRDRWWVTDPERGVVLWRLKGNRSYSPQCNGNEMITRSIVERMYPWAEVRQFPMVFVPIDVREYV